MSCWCIYGLANRNNLDQMGERFRGWIDVVEYKIKDAIKKKNLNGEVIKSPESSLNENEGLPTGSQNDPQLDSQLRTTSPSSLSGESDTTPSKGSSTPTDIKHPQTETYQPLPTSIYSIQSSSSTDSLSQNSLPSSALSVISNTPPTSSPENWLLRSSQATFSESCNDAVAPPQPTTNTASITSDIVSDKAKSALSERQTFSKRPLKFSLSDPVIFKRIPVLDSSLSSKDLLEKSDYIKQLLAEQHDFQNRKNTNFQRYHVHGDTMKSKKESWEAESQENPAEISSLEKGNENGDRSNIPSQNSSLQPEIPFSSSCNTESEKDFSSSQSSSFKAPDSGIRNRRTLKRSDCISSQMSDSSEEEDDAELMDPVLLPLGTNHELLDHAFSADSPSPYTLSLLDKLLGRARRYTSDVLENHDVENDPSQTIEELNEKAKFGRPVIPDIECDIAIRISSRVNPDLLKWFIKELKSAGLIVRPYTGYSGDQFLKVTARRTKFLKEAENMELLKRVHPDRGDGLKQFIRHKSTIFCPRQSTDGFLSAAERQRILYDFINSLRTEITVEIGGIQLHKHDVIVSRLISEKIIKQIYPLHQNSKQKILNREWVWNIFGQQPLGLVRHYFGDEIALYFAWLGFYTFILIIPLIVGLIIKRYFDDGGEASSDWCFTFYAFFNVIWPSLFLELWKRRSAELAWKWGTLGRDIEARDNQRPQFHGIQGMNPVTGHVEIQYSHIKRQVKQVLSMLVSVACLLVVLGAMLTVFRFGDYMKEVIKEKSFPSFVPTFLTRFARYLPKIMLVSTVSTLDAIYKRIAIALNNWENYRNQRTYDNWLMLKLILFKFVNSFLALFYIAFYLQDFEELRTALATLLITKQILGNCGEILGPTVIGWAKVYLLQKKASPYEETKRLPQVETESEKPKYDSSFDDYLEMFIQMGYVILFSAAYPMAAVWAFLNNLVEIRGDAFKLVNGVQRPFMKRVEDIGFWQDAFEVLSVISIVVNCSLIGIRGQVGRWFPHFTPGQQILFIICMEHLFLSIKFVISRAIPDTPGWVVLASSKEKYTRDQVLKRLEKMVRRRSRMNVSRIEGLVSGSRETNRSDTPDSELQMRFKQE